MISDPVHVKSDMKRVVEHFLKYNDSYRSLEDVCRIVNDSPGRTAPKIPTTKYAIKQLIEPAYECEYHIECPTCHKYSVGLNEICCDQRLKTLNTNHFVYIPIKQQLIRSIEKNFDEIVCYNPTTEEGVIKDLHDGVQFKKVQAKFQSKVLSIIANTDGAAVFKTIYNKSIWPVYLQQNYLLPSKRFKTSNMILAVIYFGPNEPNMKEIFYPLLLELSQIQKDGGIIVDRSGQKHTFMPILTHCCCDLPAKCKVQGISSHSGYFACGYCLHPGTLIYPKQQNYSKSKPYVRYTHSNNLTRTHTSFLDAYKQFQFKPILGIRNISCMVAAEEFDLVYGFNIDYMHCVLLGAMKKLMDLWLNSRNHMEEYYIKKRHQHIFDKRICAIKPTTDIGVQPLSVFNRSNYKAKTYRLMLLFYVRCCLPGCLDKKFIDNFELLSSAIYILLGEKITSEDIRQAEIKLQNFVESFEALYGKHSVTMNIHLMKHIAEGVRQSGPLWCQSAFSFESNNGVFVRSNNAKLNILQSMAWKYTIKPTIESALDEVIKNDVILKEKFVIQSDSTDHRLLESQGFQNLEKISTFKVLKMNSRKFSSIMAKSLQTADYFIELVEGKIGAVKFFILTENKNVYVLLEEFMTIEIFSHIRQIQSTNKTQIYSLNSIKLKLILIEVEGKKFVSSLPNMFEEN